MANSASGDERSSPEPDRPQETIRVPGPEPADERRGQGPIEFDPTSPTVIDFNDDQARPLRLVDHRQRRSVNDR